MTFLLAAIAALAAFPAAAADAAPIAAFGCADHDYLVVREEAAGIYALRRLENGGRRVRTVMVPDGISTTPAGICVAVAEVCGAERAVPAVFIPAAPVPGPAAPGCVADRD